MEDYQIVDLYWDRSERAIAESDKKYGRMLFGISKSVLSSSEDSEECVSDTYLSAWNRMPSERPTYLGAFLSKIVRNISIDRFRKNSAEKRGGKGNVVEELTECVPSGEDMQDEMENELLSGAINRFLSSLETEKRVIFVKRYFYCKEIKEISRETGISAPKIKTTLFRLREELKKTLERESLL